MNRTPTAITCNVPTDQLLPQVHMEENCFKGVHCAQCYYTRVENVRVLNQEYSAILQRLLLYWRVLFGYADSCVSFICGFDSVNLLFSDSDIRRVIKEQRSYTAEIMNGRYMRASVIR
jgi:hypothetical protein